MKSLFSGGLKKLSVCAIIALVAGIPLIAAQAMSTYTVEKGDTLYSISRKYGVTVAALKQENDIKSDNIIFVGQKLSIPGKEAGKSARTAARKAAPRRMPLPASTTCTLSRGATHSIT